MCFPAICRQGATRLLCAVSVSMFLSVPTQDVTLTGTLAVPGPFGNSLKCIFSGVPTPTNSGGFTIDPVQPSGISGVARWPLSSIPSGSVCREPAYMTRTIRPCRSLHHSTIPHLETSRTSLARMTESTHILSTSTLWISKRTQNIWAKPSSEEVYAFLQPVCSFTTNLHFPS